MKYYVTTNISENIHETPEGFLICIGVPITRTGELVYGEGETPLETDDDGQIVIDRTEGDVFDPHTMASFEGKPVTINHPDDFVNPNNWADLARGTLQNIRRGQGDEKNCLLADVLITDAMAIGLVKNGLREVSCGYEAEYVQTGKGKGRQTKIVGNHLALVEKGRAGPSCAIMDHEGKETTTMSKLAELIKKLSRVADEEMPEKKDEKKEDKSKDEKEPEKKEDKKEEKSEDASAYDELVQVCNALIEKINGMKEKKSGDEKEPEKKDEKKADDEEVAPSLEDRLKSLETAVAKMLESESSEEMGDEKEDESKDEESEEESEDDDFEESNMVGDSLSRAEILAPGIKQSKDIKVKALKAAYATKEGKEVIDSLTANKPTFDSADKVNLLFIAASEVLKEKRSQSLSKTKQAKDGDIGDSKVEIMTPEKLNEKHAAHWANR